MKTLLRAARIPLDFLLAFAQSEFGEALFFFLLVVAVGIAVGAFR